MYIRNKNNKNTYPFIGISYNPILDRYMGTLYTNNNGVVNSETFGDEFKNEKKAIQYFKEAFIRKFGTIPIASKSLKNKIRT